MTDTIIPAEPAVAPVEGLRERTSGDVYEPGDARFEQHCGAWNAMHQHRPALVVVAECTADVVEAVRFAADRGLGIGVQSTGHGVTRLIEGGVLIDTRRMQDLIVDAAARTAWVSAGCQWGPVLEAAQFHGLAPLLGSSPTVGAVGYTLGGGLGWLARRHGAAVDAVRSFELVTPDGRVVRASAEEHPELFFALRGAGAGALGVVTGMEIELFPVTTVYGGNLLYPAEQAAEVLTRYAEWAPGTPEELTSAVALMNFPPIPDVPEPLRGRSFVIVRGCWCGPIDEGRALLDAWRAELPPIMDLWDELPFAEVATISGDPVDPIPAVHTGAWLRELDAEASRVLIEATLPAGGPPLLTFSEVRHLGGAVARSAGPDTAMGNRGNTFLLNVVGMALDAEVGAAVHELQQRMRRDLAGHIAGAYLNFLDGEARRRGLAEAVDAEAVERLQLLKRDLDPADRFRYGIDLRG